VAGIADLQVLLRLKDNASAGLGKFNNRLQDMSRNMKIAGGALTVFAGIGILVGAGFLRAARTQQLALDGVKQALNTIEAPWEGNIEKIEEATAALQKKTNFGDEEQMKALAILIPALGDVDLALQALPASLDVATVKQQELKSAVQTLIPFLAGTTNTMTTLGIKVDETATFEQRLAEVLAVVGGQAEKNADPLKQLGNTFGDLQEVIGETLLPVVDSFVKVMIVVLEKVQAVPAPILMAITAIAAITVAIAAIVGPILLMAAALALLAIPLGTVALIALGVVAAIAILVLAVVGIITLIQNWDKVTAAFAVAWEASWNFVKDIFNTVLGFLEGLYRSKLGWILPGGPLIKGLLAIKDNWTGIWNGIKTAFGIVAGSIQSAYTSKFGWLLPGGPLIEAIFFIRDTWRDVWDTISSATSRVFSGISSAVSNSLKASLNVVIRALNSALSTAGSLIGKVKSGLDAISGPNPAGDALSRTASALKSGIPTLDTGAIVTGPTLAALAQNNRPEAIIPLDRAGALGGVTVNINNPTIFGEADLKALIVRAVRDHKLGGGFQGVLA